MRIWRTPYADVQAIYDCVCAGVLCFLNRWTSPLSKLYVCPLHRGPFCLFLGIFCLGSTLDYPKQKQKPHPSCMNYRDTNKRGHRHEHIHTHTLTDTHAHTQTQNQKRWLPFSNATTEKIRHEIYALASHWIQCVWGCSSPSVSVGGFQPQTQALYCLSLL